ncbi:MAG: chromosome segregation protein [Petrotoga sp.]|nr:chromosome segregation protein [Petrotoga sp.]
MKLLSLEIEGFKSFGRRTYFNLDKNIIAIIGPNGSGKSNIVDAIRWLLGEQSQKQMRISEKNDVLHIGSNGNGSSNYARVSLVVQNDDNEKIKISKILEKDTPNRYYINNKVATLKELQNIFNKGTGKSFYSIIGQGQIGEIVNSSPENIRDIVLDASNIAKYLEKKEVSINLLNKTTENLDRINDLLFVVDKRLKSLSIRAGRAKKYLEYRKEIKRIGKMYFGASKISFLKKIERYQKEIQENSQRMKSLLSELFEVERSYRNLKSEIEDTDKQLSINGDMVENYRQRVQTIENEKNQLTEELNENNSSIISKEWEMNSLEEKLDKLEQQLKELSKNERNFREIEEKTQNKTNLINEKKNRIIQEIEKQEETLKMLESELSKASQEKERKETELKNLQTTYSSNQERINLLKDQINSLKTKLENNSQKMKEIEELLSHSKGTEIQLEQRLKKKFDELKQTENSYNTLISEIDSLQQNEKNLFYTYQSLNRQINEYEGFSTTIKEFFKVFKDDDNVVDVVANLINTEERYEEAVSTIASSRIQNIVIKNSSKAKEYLDLVKKGNNGKITLLPLDLLRTKVRLQKNFLNEPGTIDFVINLVNYKQEYRKVMEYVFSNALLVDNIETAIKISKMKYPGNIVTLSGELVYSSGAITGGKSKYDHSSTVLKRKREISEIEEKLKQIRAVLSNKQELYNKVKEKLNLQKEELESIKDELRQATLTKNSHDLDYKKIKEETSNLQESITLYNEKLANYEEKNKTLDQEIQSLKMEIENNYQNTTQTTKKMHEIEETIKDKRTLLNQIEKELIGQEMELKSIKEKYEYYKNQKLAIENELKEIKIKQQKTKESFDNLKEKNDKINQSINELNKEKDSLNNEISKLFELMKQSRTGKHNKAKDLENYENRIDKLKNEVNTIKQKNQEIEFEIKEANHNIQFLKEKAQNLEINEEEFELKELSEKDIEALGNKQKELESSLKKLGSVDLTVLDEYEEVEKEYQENLKNKEDIMKSINSLKQSIKNLDEEAQRQFNTFFNNLNKEFSYFISKLFPNGYGELRLIGEGKEFEKGIQISVKKSGMNFQKLSLFSGGEKALIAIAFLFSLMNLNPSPFYILDEIDAPLDDLNAAKISDLILENSKKSQFLIITHNKIVMEIAELFYGITMREGTTYIVPVDFKELER